MLDNLSKRDKCVFLKWESYTCQNSTIFQVKIISRNFDNDGEQRTLKVVVRTLNLIAFRLILELLI